MKQTGIMGPHFTRSPAFHSSVSVSRKFVAIFTTAQQQQVGPEAIRDIILA
jgi:hypothetical protein